MDANLNRSDIALQTALKGTVRYIFHSFQSITSYLNGSNFYRTNTSNSKRAVYVKVEENGGVKTKLKMDWVSQLFSRFF